MGRCGGYNRLGSHRENLRTTLGQRAANESDHGLPGGWSTRGSCPSTAWGPMPMAGPSTPCDSSAATASRRPLTASTANGAGKGDPGRLLKLRQLLQRFTDVCNAVEYAHSRGVLHRDIKPGNITPTRRTERTEKISPRSTPSLVIFTARWASPPKCLRASKKVLVIRRQLIEADPSTPSHRSNLGTRYGTADRDAEMRPARRYRVDPPRIGHRPAGADSPDFLGLLQYSMHPVLAVRRRRRDRLGAEARRRPSGGRGGDDHPGQAVAAGGGDVARATVDPDFVPIRSRHDFQGLLLDLAFPADPFARRPPAYARGKARRFRPEPRVTHCQSFVAGLEECLAFSSISSPPTEIRSRNASTIANSLITEPATRRESTPDRSRRRPSLQSEPYSLQKPQIHPNLCNSWGKSADRIR